MHVFVVGLVSFIAGLVVSYAFRGKVHAGLDAAGNEIKKEASKL